MKLWPNASKLPDYISPVGILLFDSNETQGIPIGVFQEEDDAAEHDTVALSR